MFCRNCGTENPEDAYVCGFCGTVLQRGGAETAPKNVSDREAAQGRAAGAGSYAGVPEWGGPDSASDGSAEADSAGEKERGKRKSSGGKWKVILSLIFVLAIMAGLGYGVYRYVRNLGPRGAVRVYMEEMFREKPPTEDSDELLHDMFPKGTSSVRYWKMKGWYIEECRTYKDKDLVRLAIVQAAAMRISTASSLRGSTWSYDGMSSWEPDPWSEEVYSYDAFYEEITKRITEVALVKVSVDYEAEKSAYVDEGGGDEEEDTVYLGFALMEFDGKWMIVDVLHVSDLPRVKYMDVSEIPSDYYGQRELDLDEIEDSLTHPLINTRSAVFYD